MSTTCKCCGHEVDDLEEHLREHHGLGTWDYWEIGTLRSDLTKSCLDCGTLRYLASPFIPGFYLPCPKCSTKEFATGHLTTKFADLQKTTRTDKVQAAIIASPGLLGASLGKDLYTACGLLKPSGRLTKDTYLGFVWKPGYPKEISERNKGAWQTLTIEIPVGRDLLVKIQDRAYQILLPENCGYDVRHHSRYSILSDGSSKSSRYTKRIRVESEVCYKFWNNRGISEAKSIFRVVIPGTLGRAEVPGPDLCLLKQVILRNKVTSGILWSIFNEVLKYSRSLDDRVLLRNKVPIYPWGKVDFGFAWTPEAFIDSHGGPGEVNISIL